MATLSADTGLRASLGTFLLTCIFLTTTYDTTFFFDRPVNSIVFTCFLSGVSLIILGKIIPRLPAPTSTSYKHRYSVIPLAERNVSPSGEIPSSPGSPNGKVSVSKSRDSGRWIRIAAVAGIACIRVEIYRRISLNTECAPTGYSYAIPCLVSIYDYWRNVRHRLAHHQRSFSDSVDPGDGRLYKAAKLSQRARLSLCRARTRYVISASLLMVGGLVASSFHDGRQSTFICPTTSQLGPYLSSVGLFSTLLDSVILVAAAELSREGTRSQDGAKRPSPTPWGYCLLGVAFIWLVTGIVLARRNHVPILVPDDRYFRSAFGQASLVVILLVSGFQLISHYNIVGLSIVAGFISGYFSWASALFNGQQPYPFIPPSHASIALFAMSLGTMLFFCSRTVSGDEQKPLYGFNIFMRISIIVMTGIGIILVSKQPALGSLHPIDLLIYESRIHHDTWLAQARSTEGLVGAVREYRRRYKQHPPPGFDIWYKYATSRSSVIMDDFDQIYEDLLPFRTLSPERLREITHEVATNPSNDVGAISVRNGSAKVQEEMKPTHRWMVESAAKVMEPFSQYLPDMDLIFNLNDEPRVAVPWGKATQMKNLAKAQPLIPVDNVIKEWSTDRALGWGPVDPADQTSFTMFTDTSWTNVFDRFVSVVCPPSSKARSQRIWDRHGICLSCIRPHSLGQFPVDWNIESDICHQPDIKWLHGFMLSPASLKVTQDLAPVFSQSKISGFNDILFPSPWNYVDKVKYEPSKEYPDPPYMNKENSLFWIGSTSEGVSNKGEWKGMPRQRLTHFINNNTLNKVSVLLPTREPETYSYQIMDGGAPSRELGLKANVHVSDYVRCGDCDQQQEEMKMAPHVEFQSHWNYRYLVDLDGAGFSGRFLPFLKSHSLPMKAGLFRQWFDSRITTWLHYVPLDIRLHDVWSTLAYFAGVDVPVTDPKTGETKPMMKPHDIQGKWIANEGRKWAEKALRKEDMEIYFFRLLLEWGRLTDDRRDSLGFKL